MTKHYQHILPETLSSIKQYWVRLKEHDSISIQEIIEHRYQVNLSNNPFQRAAREDNGCLILPIDLIVYHEDKFIESKIVFALFHDRLVSIEQEHGSAALDQLSKNIQASFDQIGYQSSKRLLLSIFQSLHQMTQHVMREISTVLDERGEVVAIASGGFEFSRQQVGVADIADTAIALSEAEELIAKSIETQLMLARACRWLRRRMNHQDAYKSIGLLISDIQSLKRYALFQHDKIRNLQQSLMTTMDIKQNQVVKVFTVVTAVFTPPTLIAAFYGQNFAYMPELALPVGEWIVMLLTGFFALIPLYYIKQKGWMR